MQGCKLVGFSNIYEHSWLLHARTDHDNDNDDQARDDGGS